MRRNYKSYLTERGDVNEAGALDRVFRNLLPGQIEDVIDSPVINNNGAVFEINVIEALNKTVSYSGIPPELRTGKWH